MTSATVYVWEAERGGGPCDASPGDLVAHGLGHALGFADNYSGDCYGTIMGRPYTGVPLSVTTDYCHLLDPRWETDFEEGECVDPFAPGCECDIDPWAAGCGNSPIVVNLDGASFNFSDVDELVEFDIDGDGERERITWIAPGSVDGFLCRDLDQNGVIDSGTELLGNYSRLRDGRLEAHGYEVLAEVDSLLFGGDANGVVDSFDAGYFDLCIWVDANQNGVSENGEVGNLADVGLEALDTSFVVSLRRDAAGNTMRYKSRAWLRDGAERRRIVETVDVFFIRVTQ